MRIWICVLVLTMCCSAVTWIDIAENWLYEGDYWADLNGDGIVNFYDYALTTVGALSVNDITVPQENGNWIDCTITSVNHISGHVDPTGSGGYPYWFYFQLNEKAAGQTITVELPNHHYTNSYPVFRYQIDGQWTDWGYTDKRSLGRSFSHTVAAEAEKAEFAFTFPIFYSEYQDYINSISDHEHVISIINGSSIDGRNVPFLTITDPAVSDLTKQVVWLTGGIHCGENNSTWMLRGLIEYLLSQQGGQYREKYIFKILPLLNPDGLYRGYSRTNANLKDLNREYNKYPAEPEINFSRNMLDQWLEGNSVDIWLDFHDASYHLVYMQPESDVGSQQYNQTLELMDDIRDFTTVWDAGNQLDRTIAGSGFWYGGTVNGIISISLEYGFNSGKFDSIAELKNEGAGILKGLDLFLSK